jgi:molybdopterin/thiamine biosynthesis adenylyltransferase
MINLNKHLEFFNPLEIEEDIHIIGVGAIGSNLALMLTRLGCNNIHLYDFDKVEPINIANQNYFNDQIGKDKTLATLQNMLQINPEIEFQLHNKGWEPGMVMSGYIFLCLDNIDIRRQVVEACKNNKYVKAILDFRMGLADAQHYMADLSNANATKRLLETMDFTHEEAKQALPVSACGTSLSVLPTIWTVVSAGVANFINFCKKGDYKHTILVNPFMSTTDAF